MHLKCYMVFREYMSQKDKFWFSHQVKLLVVVGYTPGHFWIFDKKKSITIKPHFFQFARKDANKWLSTFHLLYGVRVFGECSRQINKSVLFWDIYITFRQWRRTPLLIISRIMIFSGMSYNFPGETCFPGRLGYKARLGYSTGWVTRDSVATCASQCGACGQYQSTDWRSK